jgi:molecular chaperone HscA
LTDEEIERMLEEAIDLGEEDIEQRLLIIARNEADQILAALYKQLSEYGSLIDDDERKGMEAVAAKLDSARSGSDREQISKLVEDLNEASTPFAERIMNRAIKLVLEAKSVDEVA